MNAVSGLMSRMRWRNGAKSGLARGIRIELHDLAAELGEALLERGFRFGTRRPLVDQRNGALAAVLCRPFAHDPGGLGENEAGAHEIRRRGRGDGSARDHHHGRDLGLGHERAVGEHRRRDPAADDLHLVVDDHLLDQAARVVGNAGVVAQDQFDLLAGDHAAVLLDVQPRAGRGLPAGRGETRAGHGEAHADLDHVLRKRAAGRERDRADRDKCHGELSASHRILPLPHAALRGFGRLHWPKSGNPNLGCDARRFGG